VGKVQAEQFSIGRSHSRFKELLGIHLAQTLKSPDGKTAAANFFHAGKNLRDGEERLYLLLVPFAFDYFEERLILRRIVLNAQSLLCQFAKQVGDGFAFMQLDVARPARVPV